MRNTCRWPWFCGILCAVTVCLGATAAFAATSGKEILDEAGVKGGLVVHLGCGDGKLTAALYGNDRYLVHGLDSDAANVAAVRSHIHSLGLYGKVSIDTFDGKRLPYVDNLINLVVAEDLGDVPMAEVMRVLVPEGTALIGGKKTVKPRRDGIDDWTHYLHNSTNNAVADDTVVGPPKHLQWVGSPRWTRHHDHMSSFNALVSAGGRVFYIFDEGPTQQIQLPANFSLIARDAFNGTILWKRQLEPWHTQLWMLKSGPALIPRRLVAVGDRVYVTLGLDKPVSALDAATGETLRTYEPGTSADELIHSDGVLYIVVNAKPDARPWATIPSWKRVADVGSESAKWAWNAPPREIVAVEADTGNVQWRTDTTVVPMTLAADDDRVLWHDGKHVVCLDRTTGERKWQSDPILRASDIRSWFAPTLVIHNDVVLFAGGEKILRHKGGRDTMTALDANTGQTLWIADHPPSGYDSPEDVLVIGGLVWTAPTTNKRDTGQFTGRNLYNGEVEVSFPADDGVHMPHHRCHRAKATVNYVLASRTGIEYVDLNAKHWDRNDWVRGACLYGIMPANGLTYAPPHSCACYIVAKSCGFNALAAERESKSRTVEESKDETRLEKGPAYEQIGNRQSQIENHNDWPTYRRDMARSGCATTTVPTGLTTKWRTPIDGKLSSLVSAGGRLVVAQVDKHTVHALNADTGETLWSYTVGGRVDSPPTIWNDQVLFGSADGYIYCLRADDGKLIWRFRAAPTDQRLMSFEQIESVWPVHGSVLVHDGVVHAVAGRSMFLDGGMRYLRLDAATGQKVSETILDNINPETGKPLDDDIAWPNLPVALPDVLSADDKYVYMRSQPFDFEGKRAGVPKPINAMQQTGEGAHLLCPTGFLDDTWWHRTYWFWGRTPASAAGAWYRAAYNAPAGRIMVFDDDNVYAFGRKPEHFPSTTILEYHLFSSAKEPDFKRLNTTVPGRKPAAPSKQPTRRPKAKQSSPGAKATAAPKAKITPARTKPGEIHPSWQAARRQLPHRPVYAWSEEVPLQGRALVLAGKVLFVAGPPDVVDTQTTATAIDDPANQARLQTQVDAIEGRRGGVLWAVSAADGTKLTEFRLASPPTWDGMIAAGGRLYLSCLDGSVICLGDD